MSMLTLNGQLINAYRTPEGEKDGKAYPSQEKVQILGEVVLPNGESKRDLITLTTHNKEYFDGLEGQNICVPVSVFVSGKSVTYFIPKGSKPVPLLQ